MARYSMYSGEQIQTHVLEDFDTRADVVRANHAVLINPEDRALLNSNPKEISIQPRTRPRSYNGYDSGGRHRGHNNSFRHNGK